MITGEILIFNLLGTSKSYESVISTSSSIASDFHSKGQPWRRGSHHNSPKVRFYAGLPSKEDKLFSRLELNAF